jgi:hypothetical protein
MITPFVVLGGSARLLLPCHGLEVWEEQPLLESAGEGPARRHVLTSRKVTRLTIKSTLRSQSGVGACFEIESDMGWLRKLRIAEL